MDKFEARVPLLDRGRVPAEARAAYEHVAQSRGGRMANVFKALANSPSALEKVAAVGEFVRYQAGMNDMLRELAILTTAYETRCVYEWTHHWPIARKAGASAELLASIGTAKIEREPDPVGVVVRYAGMVARAEEVDDATVEALKSRLGASGLVDLTVTIGYYGMLGRLINALGVPLDEGVTVQPWPSRSRR